MNVIEVDVEENISQHLPMPQQEIITFVERLLSVLEIDQVELSIFLCTDGTIAELNATYRGKHGPTDILSFSQVEGDSIGQGDVTMLGDLVISLETLKRNAEYFKVPVQQEFKRLMIHGILHLQGEEHLTNKPVEPMLQYQEHILEMLENDHA
ncbi:MAG: rRNA maturation RNase YbeY [Spirochaetota bacterium]